MDYNATDRLMVKRNFLLQFDFYTDHIDVYSVVFLRKVTTVILKIPCSHFLVLNGPVAKKKKSGLSFSSILGS